MFAHKQYWRSVGEAFRLPSITAMLSGGETPPLQGLCVSANTPLNINLSLYIPILPFKVSIPKRMSISGFFSDEYRVSRRSSSCSRKYLGSMTSMS